MDMDPLSRLCRLATSVPPPRLHTIRYAGVLAPASPWRSRLAPQAPPQAPAANDKPGRPDLAGGYRPWGELLARTFAVDVLACPTCQGRMKLLALVKDPASISRYLAAAGEAAEVKLRSPGRGPARARRDGALPGRGERTRRGASGGAEGPGWPPATMRVDRRTALVLPTLPPGRRAAPAGPTSKCAR